jgi:Reverse transcriptase (RNA-dependent DNA polymerase)
LVDYDKTTAPTAHLESFRSLLHIAAVLDWDVQHVDIKTAFLHGVLPESETVFMEQPPGFEAPGQEDWVMKLMKSLYGMKQASRIWNKTFHKTVSSLGFRRLACEWCVYRRRTKTGITIFAVHVDDIISISSSPDENARFKTELRQHWEISDLGDIKFALGIAIHRNRDTRTVSLSQTALIDRVIEQFGQLDAHPVDTPIPTGVQILRPNKNLPISGLLASWMERTPYRSLVGTLNYLAVATRPDIAYAVGRLASVLDCYRPEHWDAAIRVVRYLKGTRLFCLRLGGSNSVQPIGFSDSDYANCPVTSRSIGGYCFSLGSGMVSWQSHKQPHTADSTCYAEYIALHDASHEVMFLRQLMEGLEMLFVDPTHLYCDSESARKLTEDQRWHSRTKHIRVKYHSIRDLIDFDELRVLGVRTHDNTADIFTKPLARPAFERFRHYLGLHPPT